MRNVMRVCIGSKRVPDGRYAEIDLPASPYRMLDALDELGIKSTRDIVYQEVLDYGDFGYLEPHFDEYTRLEELNALTKKLSTFDRVDAISFEGIVKMAEQKPEPFGVKELINFAYSTESCHVVSDVFNDEQLGRFYTGNGFMPEYENLPDNIYEHLDFAKIGREAREAEGGVYTRRGYVLRDDEIVQVYDAMDLELKKPEYGMRLVLTSEEDGQCVCLDLPATQKQIDLCLMEIDLDCWEGAKLHDYDGPVWDMNIDLYELGGFDSLNELAKVAQELDANGQLTKFKAVIAANDCHDVQEAIGLAEHLDDYCFDPVLYSPESIGREGIRAIASDSDAEMLTKHINLYAFGKDYMESCGFKLTDYGVVVSNVAPSLEQAEAQAPQMTM